MSVRIGIVGTGFISGHFLSTVDWHDGYQVTRVMTRRPIDSVSYPEPTLLTGSLDDLLEASDVVFECSGDPVHAASVVAAAIDAGLPVVTMNAEFHITAGSYFVGKGVITEAEGDQPGSLAALHEEAVGKGFKPLVYGNMKGFLNHNPNPDEMLYWAEKQGLSLAMTTSFTDGTKLQIEQALVANGLHATIAREGLIGPAVDTLDEAATLLAAQADAAGAPISDYVLSRALSHGVFIVAEHQQEHRAALTYFKMGEGPRYLLVTPNIMVHLEVMKTIKRVAAGGVPLLDNSPRPSVSVAALAKRHLEPGTTIRHGIGSFDTRGVAVKIADHVGHLPIGLLSDATVVRRVSAGEFMTFDDVEIPESLALEAWRDTERRVVS